jgi:beta-phosphoglucomutase-like phosphatase (HAD superfamily)
MHTYQKPFIFDLSGTMVIDMLHHRQAWYTILNNDLSWDTVKQEMHGKNVGLLIRVFGPGRFLQMASAMA